MSHEPKVYREQVMSDSHEDESPRERRQRYTLVGLSLLLALMFLAGSVFAAPSDESMPLPTLVLYGIGGIIAIPVVNRAVRLTRNR